MLDIVQAASKERSAPGEKPPEVVAIEDVSPKSSDVLQPKANALGYDTGEDMTFPKEGIRAWLVVLGSWCGMIATFGIANTTGVLQEYLVKHTLSQYSESDVSWIFSIWLFIMFVGSIQVGPLFDTFGARALLIPGGVCQVLSVFFLAWSKEYYQFILGFSVLGGLGSTMIFNPCITVIAHWFWKRRAFATGIAASGGAIGGIMFSLSLSKLLETTSYAWSIRVMGFVVLFLCAVCATLVDSRGQKKKAFTNAVIDFKALKDWEFLTLTFAVFLVEWGVFIPINYIASYCVSRGLTTTYSNQVLAYLNVGSVFGRACPGYFADKWGAFNVMITTSFICGVLCLAVWLPAGSTKAGVTAFAVLFGFWSGSTISLTPVCVARLSPTKDYGRRYGTCYFFSSFAALTGLPIAGSLTDHHFLGLILFAGLIYLLGSLFFLISRLFAVGKQPIF
ncbi:putative transporter MCH4 [Wickerhamiella sorbophila]|uniref:Putative transporter MCH4 n=1 Tax=Wickerhamiella sorbophila TaxID=45607 RepID=A0A2T0FMT1_9ASCO|nr:putative transporter MCH4 [Wickerhamiella sorbophila]PRT56277.1 putative transporter MCH4 [Wickerhamiella sorbophila]